MPTPIASQSRRTGAPAPAMFRKQLQAVCCFVLGMTVSLFVLPSRLGRQRVSWDNGARLVDRNNQSKASGLRSSPSMSPPMPRPSGHFYDATPGQVYGRAPRLLIGVLSAPSHRKQRDTIRHSWFHISTKQSWEPWFIIGKSPDPRVRAALRAEQEEERDMVIFDRVEEGYLAISRKVEAFFQWSLRAWGGGNNRPGHRPDFVLKTDDDSAVEVPMLLEALKHKPHKKLYWGRPRMQSPVIRPGSKRSQETHASKWVVTKEEYEGEFFPTYMGGAGYLLSIDLVEKINQKTARPGHQPFKFEDVNVGILLNDEDYEPEGNRQFFLEPRSDDRMFEGSTQTFVHHRMTPKEFEAFGLEKRLNPELPWRRHPNNK